MLSRTPISNGSSQSASTKTPIVPAKPSFTLSNVSFIVKVVEVRPNYAEESNLSHNNPYGFFRPPVRKEGFRADDAVYFQWHGGRMTRIQPPTPLVRYSEATVFSQKDDTDHLLGVDINALERDVASWNPGWRVLSFDHVAHSNGTYSYINLLGGQKHLAAKGSSTWMGQLLPVEYNYQRTTPEGEPFPSSTTSAGLIGSLPILVALAAFSAPQNSLVPILASSMTRMAWKRHNLPTGRVPERGMVVTVYYDPGNATGSSKHILDRLQNGAYGPFYR